MGGPLLRAGEFPRLMSQLVQKCWATECNARQDPLIVSTAQVLLEQARQFHRSGDFQRAAELYENVLSQHPNSVDVQYLLGTLRLQLTDFQASIELLQEVVRLQPTRADAANNLGIAHKAIGDWESAARRFEEAIQADPDYVQAWFNLASLMAERGLFADAAKCFQRAVELDPDDLAAQLGLANALSQTQDWSAAESRLRHLLSDHPGHPEALIILGFVLVKLERLDEAAEAYQTVLANQPDFYQIHNSMSFVLERQGRCVEALKAADTALDLNAEFAEGHNNRGVALKSLHRFDEAQQSFRRALTLQPDFALAEFNLGTTQLLLGDYQQGWQGYLRYAELTEDLPTFGGPKWDGLAMPGQTLLVSSDQGFGDTLQFVRWLPQIRAQCQARVVLDCQPELAPLLAQSPLADHVVVDASEVAADAGVALSQLGALLQVTDEDLPGPVSYLTCAKEPGTEAAAALESAPHDHLRVGLAWQGNPLQPRDFVRSCALQTLSSWNALERVTWFGLQTGQLGRSQIASLSSDWPLIDLGGTLHDFHETAAVIQQLHLVITVDTALAHLAGALGVPVWVLLCHTPDWRWQLERDDCVWYPSMRVFRQPVWGDWASVADVVRQALEAWVISGG